MVSPTEKAESIFPMAAISKDGSIREKLKDKTIFSFTPMAPFIEVLSVIRRKMDSADFSSIMVSSIPVFGLTENLMPIKQSKFIPMEASTLEVSPMESRKEKASIFGLTEKYILGSLKTAKCMVKEF
jgi:hypothetical protein